MTVHPSVPPGLDSLGATWLSAQQWPFPSGRLHAGSLDIAVTDVGSGPTLLLVHVGLWSFLWRDVITDLSRDFRVVTPLFDEVEQILREQLSDCPLLTIFGEDQDPFGFQDQWQRLFPTADRVVVPQSHHFPMNDDPAAVAGAIRNFHRRRVAAKLVSYVKEIQQ